MNQQKPHYTPEQVEEICERLERLKEPNFSSVENLENEAKPVIESRTCNPIGAILLLNSKILSAFNETIKGCDGFAFLVIFLLAATYALTALWIGFIISFAPIVAIWWVGAWFLYN